MEVGEEELSWYIGRDIGYQDPMGHRQEDPAHCEPLFQGEVLRPLGLQEKYGLAVHLGGCDNG